jgi:hypothetical protein
VEGGKKGVREGGREGGREGERAYLFFDTDAVADDAQRAVLVRARASH